MIFILEGKIRTHQGVYGTGTWVWLPQGETMEHRSTDKGDMVRIFIIDGALEIH
jgi:hypothetical protein